MTEERLHEILSAERDYRLNGPEECLILLGMNIFAKYLPKKRLIECAEHDIIFGPPLADLADAGITEEDAAALRKARWRVDEYGEGISHYV